jgi:hypothetical protein
VRKITLGAIRNQNKAQQNDALFDHLAKKDDQRTMG